MKEKNISAVWVAAVILLLLPFIAYTAGYLLRCKVEVDPFSDTPENPITFREYPNAWEATIFHPAAKIESAMTGRQMKTVYTDAITLRDARIRVPLLDE